MDYLTGRLISGYLTPLAYYNPFGFSLTFYNFGPDEFDPAVATDVRSSIKSTSGFRGSFDRINYEVAYSYFVNDNSSQKTNQVTSESLNTAVNRGNALALNLVGIWANSPEQIAQLDFQTATSSSQNQMQTFDAKIDGDLLDWAGGTVKFALGYEHRIVKYSYDPETYGYTSYNRFGGLEDSFKEAVSRSRNIDAVFGELLVPLYEDADTEALVSSVDVTVASRWQKYSDFGTSTVAQFAGRVGFLDETFMIRASYANSFKAPTVEELTRPFSTSYGSVPGFDETRGGNFPYAIISGGNPDLEPEKGTSWNIGLVYRPDIEGQLLVKLDYWNLKIHNRITTPSVGALLNNTSTSGSKTYDPITGEATLDVRVNNSGDSRNLSGIDFGVMYGFDTQEIGQFSFDFNGTYMTKYYDIDTGEKADYLGRYSSVAGPIPKLRARLSSRWSMEGWSISNVINYSGSYDDISESAEFSFIERRTKAYITVGLQASYLFDEDSSLEGLQIYGGITDLFNADLTFVNNAGGWDKYLNSYRGRSFYIGARQKF